MRKKFIKDYIRRDYRLESALGYSDARAAII